MEARINVLEQLVEILENKVIELQEKLNIAEINIALLRSANSANSTNHQNYNNDQHPQSDANPPSAANLPSAANPQSDPTPQSNINQPIQVDPAEDIIMISSNDDSLSTVDYYNSPAHSPSSPIMTSTPRTSQT